ncbi:MAG: hypothetical protein GT601_15290 [Acidaminobacter sp.]|nr:hypothetical protein [Acidaminobacter sp.]
MRKLTFGERRVLEDGGVNWPEAADTRFIVNALPMVGSVTFCDHRHSFYF